MRLPGMRHAAALLLAAASLPALADPISVTVRNDTTPTQCAEEDNVSFVLSAPALAALRIEALHPAYIETITADSSAPDFSGCNFGDTPHPTDPRHEFTPRKVTLYDGPTLAIIGITFDSFWRPQRVPVNVAGREDTGGFHLIQFFHKPSASAKPATATGGASVPAAKAKSANRPAAPVPASGSAPSAPMPGTPALDPNMEFLVLYPSDGYWRAKPLPSRTLGVNAYGSSFLLGPIEQQGRPVVNISRIDIVPGARPGEVPTIKTSFAKGGSATLSISAIDAKHTQLDTRFDPPYVATGGKDAPFAMLRSMYVTRENADMSMVAWRETRGGEPRAKAPDQIDTISASGVRFGRAVVSKHNTSAPDMAFERFESPER